ncbi:preprotein translocase subunit SecE [Fulvivirga sedimenti]|jgi:preprotein translocase subunit SecE|uniref:Protein translocase subunit SecE n=1 Tax=Fulvivirga sedimenti TaxID=2879465 RepID=A0A9X1HUC3_9BACT|nr:preprotein translocase subunit SecE [Fulvivirga sedimenti]MCA6078096.1 preprotein translocase subunit SecE [Fulvivirga sedimenti]
MQKVVKYIKESYHEMRDKVSWPKYSELQSSSILVLIASMIFSLAIFLMDYVFQNGMEWIYSFNQ